jgi:hypothetical protein
MRKALTICQLCGTIAKPRRASFGEIAGLLFLSCIGLLPGIVYAVALSLLYPCCPACGNKALIPVGTPYGRDLVEDRLAHPRVGPE